MIHGKNERRQCLVPKALMMSGDSRSLYLVDVSDEHIYLYTGTLVAQVEDAKGV